MIRECIDCGNDYDTATDYGGCPHNRMSVAGATGEALAAIRVLCLRAGVADRGTVVEMVAQMLAQVEASALVMAPSQDERFAALLSDLRELEQAERHTPPPPADVVVLEAVVSAFEELQACGIYLSAFERLQACGIYLHDAAGVALDRQQFIAALHASHDTPIGKD